MLYHKRDVAEPEMQSRHRRSPTYHPLRPPLASGRWFLALDEIRAGNGIVTSGVVDRSYCCYDPSRGLQDGDIPFRPLSPPFDPMPPYGPLNFDDPDPFGLYERYDQIFERFPCDRIPDCEYPANDMEPFVVEAPVNSPACLL